MDAADSDGDSRDGLVGIKCLRLDPGCSSISRSLSTEHRYGALESLLALLRDPAVVVHVPLKQVLAPT